MPVLPDRKVINQIISGHYADPFSVLGMHQTEQGLQVCALLPDAKEVWLVDAASGRNIAQMTQEDPRGFFIAKLSRRKNPFRYQLAVTWQESTQIIEDPYRFGTLLQDIDSWLLAEGTHLRPYERLGAHLMSLDGGAGVSFTVWAPNAKRVSVVGEFNFWDGRRHPMRLRRENGIWELFLPGVQEGQLYKFEVIDSNGQMRLKADPYAFKAQMRPETASIISPLPEVVANQWHSVKLLPEPEKNSIAFWDA